MPDPKPKPIPKFFRDVIAYKGACLSDTLIAGQKSPICRKCRLDECSPVTPYMDYGGSTDPLITFVFDAPSRKEDVKGHLGGDGTSAFLLKAIAEIVKNSAGKFAFDTSRIRWAATTRCAVNEGKGNPATGGKWCRNYLLEDFQAHPPKLIIPIGSVALGLLCHKSNVQDWGGKLLNWRGWPDDWLIDEKFEKGHPVFGPRPDSRIPMLALQKPQMVFASRNAKLINQWFGQLKTALELALSDIQAKVYDKPWWKITTSPREVAEACTQLIEHPGTILTYDTETTGLKPWHGQKIVFMMFRWDDPVTGEPRALGWPWDYDNEKIIADHPELAAKFGIGPSPMLPYLADLAPFVLEALRVSKLRGHNLTFDLLFTIATLLGGKEYLNQLCESFFEDSWHMRYCLRQEKGSLSLDLLAYDWAPELAGYEEEMTLMIDRYPELMDPKKGGHYANCPPEYWQTHFRPYVMGDVEVCHEAAGNLNEKLDTAQRYTIPLAHPTERGRFRQFTPPGRDFVYKKILRPAASVLAKMMARGVFVNGEELANQEVLYPKMIFESRAKLRSGDPRLAAWCDSQEAADPEWEFDLENKGILKSALFEVLDLPINILTDAGDKVHKTLAGVPKADLIKYASTDKFTINSLAVSHPQVRPLLEYRTLHKAYTSYVRPMHNITTPGIDKRPRKDLQLLMLDGCIHATFGLVATRSGRLGCCVDGDTDLEVFVGGKSSLVKIQDLIVTDDSFIKTHKFRLRRILRRYEKPDDLMFEVEIHTGESITCTPGHKFLTNAGWEELGNLRIGSILQTDAAPPTSYGEIVSITYRGVRKVWDIEVDEDHSYMAQGFINHNSNPNLQQIPRDGMIKRLYASRFGALGAIYQGDLSQIELRIMAATCGDPTMVQAYLDDIDLHSLTTSKVFGIPFEKFGDDYTLWCQSNNREKEVKELKNKRKIGKTLNFLTGYGGGAKGFQSALALQGIYLEEKECEANVNGFFETYPFLRKYIGAYKDFISKSGVAVSLFGRVRVLPEVFSEDAQQANKALRAGVNHEIQSSSSDIMLACLIAIEALMREADLQSMLVLTVHDSLAIDCLRTELQAVHEICTEVFSNIDDVLQAVYGPNLDLSWLILPLAASAEVGTNYGNAKTIRAGDLNPDWKALLTA